MFCLFLTNFCEFVQKFVKALLFEVIFFQIFNFQNVEYGIRELLYESYGYRNLYKSVDYPAFGILSLIFCYWDFCTKIE